MGAIGVGVGVGLARKDVLAPPFKKDITRWFKSRNGSTLIDSVAGRNATVLFPVSTFNGVDSRTKTNEVFVNKGDSIEAYINFKNGTINNLHGTYKFYFGFISNQALRVEIWGVNNLISFQPQENTSYKINIDYRSTTNDYSIKINNTEVGTSVIGTESNDTTIGVQLGTRGDVFVNGSLWGYKLTDRNNVLKLSIPLPHLGYGIKADGTAVTLTNTNVGVDYHKDGSPHMLDYGCVKREPELYTDGAFNDINLTRARNDGRSTISLVNNTCLLSAQTSATALSLGIILGSFGKERDYLIKCRARSNKSNVLRCTTSSDLYNITPNWQDFVFKGKQGTSNDVVIYQYYGSTVGTEWLELDDVSIVRTDVTIPNKTDGTPLLPLITGDTLIAGSPNFLNDSDFMVDMTGGVTDTTTLAEPEYAFFNKTNTAIWK